MGFGLYEKLKNNIFIKSSNLPGNEWVRAGQKVGQFLFMEMASTFLLSHLILPVLYFFCPAWKCQYCIYDMLLSAAGTYSDANEKMFVQVFYMILMAMTKARNFIKKYLSKLSIQYLFHFIFYFRISFWKLLWNFFEDLKQKVQAKENKYVI